MEEWITTQEAARSLAVSNSRIRAMAGAGLLVTEKRGRDLMVSVLSVTAQKSDYGQLSTPVRIRVFLRDSLTCQSCAFASGDPSSFHVHHKQPRSEGGTNTLENLTTLCCDCHKATHGRTDKLSEAVQFNCRLADEIQVLIRSEVVRLSDELGKKVSQADVVALAMVQWCSVDHSTPGESAQSDGSGEGVDRHSAAEAALRDAETRPAQVSSTPKVNPRAESVAQRKVREAKEHAVSLAEADVIARAVGREDIDYDLDSVAHRSALAVNPPVKATERVHYKVQPRKVKPITRPCGTTEPKRRREQ